MTPQQEKVVRAMSKTSETTSSGVPYYQATMAQIHEDLYGAQATEKVVGKKVVGVKPRGGAKTSNKLTREAIAAMSPEEYTKRKTEINAAAAEGAL